MLSSLGKKIFLDRYARKFDTATPADRKGDNFAAGGGVGINLSSLRPKDSPVRGVSGRSSGAVSWGALYSFATGLICQGGSRRGALGLVINDWHPDVLEFVSCKQKVELSKMLMCLSLYQML